MKTLRQAILTLLITVLSASCASGQDWRTASRDSIGLAPLPENESEALVHVYSARTVSWRGYFAVHSWIATKEKNADHYMTYHVIGWRLRRGQSVVVVEQEIPDRRWFGAAPDLIFELKGPRAEEAIPKIIEAAASYPHAQKYRAWPGPNSNTFVSYILRRTPEIGVELPPHAIGKDWINDGDLFGVSETRTGFQFSILGVAGFTLGLGDGVEVNLLGMSFGIDVWRPALKLPFIGRLGFPDAPVLIK